MNGGMRSRPFAEASVENYSFGEYPLPFSASRSCIAAKTGIGGSPAPWFCRLPGISFNLVTLEVSLMLVSALIHSSCAPGTVEVLLVCLEN